MWHGIMLYAGSYEFVIVFTVVFLIYYTLIAMAEEKFLKGKFVRHILTGHQQFRHFFLVD